MRAFNVVLACALAAWAVPVNAVAQGSESPVTINACSTYIQPNPVQTNAPTFMGVPIAALTSKSAGMRISFVNNSKQIAKLVNFEIDSNGNEFIVRDAGTFSPGVLIDHSFKNGAGQNFILPAFISPKLKCRVASVEFADGSMWRHGQPPNVVPVAIPPAPPGRLSIVPPSVVLENQSESALFMVQTSSRIAGLKQTDNCAGIASVFVGASADRATSYYVKPIAAGKCAAHVIDENGATASIPIEVR